MMPKIALLALMAAVLLVSGCTIPEGSLNRGFISVSAHDACTGQPAFYYYSEHYTYSGSPPEWKTPAMTPSNPTNETTLHPVRVISYVGEGHVPDMWCISTERLCAGQSMVIYPQGYYSTVSYDLKIEPEGGCPGSAPATGVITAPPEPTYAELMTSLMGAVIEWAYGIMQILFPQAGLAVPASSFVGQPATFSASISGIPLPDTDWSDGGVERHYAIGFIADQTGAIRYNTGQEEVMGATYSRTFSWTPTAAGRYMAGAVILRTSNSFDYATEEWTGWTEPEVIRSDQSAVMVQQVGEPGMVPNFNIGELFQSLLDWIRSLFGG